MLPLDRKHAEQGLADVNDEGSEVAFVSALDVCGSVREHRKPLIKGKACSLV